MLEIYQELAKVIANGERAILATVITSRGSAPRKAGAKILIKEDGSFIGTVGGGGVEQEVRQRASALMRSGEPQVIHLDLSGKEENTAMICGGQMNIFMEPILPAETLYLCGAGHIAQSTAAMGKMLGFRIVVIDPRPEFNNIDRFPEADSLVVEDFATAIAKLDIHEDGYIVIYTHGHIFDEECLQAALGTGAKYIGMIGSKKKVKEVKERLLKKRIDQQKLEAVQSPIGIEIGAVTPAEIAISILAEIIKKKRD